MEENIARIERRIVDKLIAHRQARGMSQSAVARRMKVPQSAIVRFERRTHSPTLKTIARYAAAVGARSVEVNWR